MNPFVYWRNWWRRLGPVERITVGLLSAAAAALLLMASGAGAQARSAARSCWFCYGPAHVEARYHRRRWRHGSSGAPVDCEQVRQDVANLAADPDRDRLARVVRGLGARRCAEIARCIDQNEETLCRPKDAP
jgi:hypothetical protein